MSTSTAHPPSLRIAHALTTFATRMSTPVIAHTTTATTRVVAHRPKKGKSSRSATLPSGRITEVLRGMPFVCNKQTAHNLRISVPSLHNYVQLCLQKGWARSTPVKTENNQTARYLECLVPVPAPEVPRPSTVPLPDLRTATTAELRDAFTLAGIDRMQATSRPGFVRLLHATAQVDIFYSGEKYGQAIGLTHGTLCRYLIRAVEWGLLTRLSPPGVTYRLQYRITDKGRHTVAAALQLIKRQSPQAKAKDPTCQHKMQIVPDHIDGPQFVCTECGHQTPARKA